MSKVKRIELGCAGHFIGGRDCLFRRHTQVGRFRVSTVGNYMPGGSRTSLGYPEGSFFETMVFPTSNEMDTSNEGCGCRVVLAWSGLDYKRYATAGEAQAGHEAMVAKYLKKSAPRPARSPGADHERKE